MKTSFEHLKLFSILKSQNNESKAYPILNSENNPFLSFHLCVLF